jgi:hypothetical protein
MDVFFHGLTCFFRGVLKTGLPEGKRGIVAANGTDCPVYAAAEMPARDSGNTDLH